MPGGRPPKPTALKLLHGTARADRMNPAEPQPPTLVQTKPPAWLTPRGKKAWKELAPILIEMGVLTIGDRAALLLLCDAYDEWQTAREIVRRDSPLQEVEGRYGVTLHRHPAVDVAADAWRRVSAMMVQFGLTPASRSKVSASPEKEVDPFEEYLNGARSR